MSTAKVIPFNTVVNALPRRPRNTDVRSREYLTPLESNKGSIRGAHSATTDTRAQRECPSPREMTRLIVSLEQNNTAPFV